jgi:hypothetical protein
VLFPAPGPWVFNPVDPRLAANLHAHVELRAPEGRAT